MPRATRNRRYADDEVEEIDVDYSDSDSDIEDHIIVFKDKTLSELLSPCWFIPVPTHPWFGC